MQEGYVNDREVVDVNDAAYANQKRMHSNPFEVMLVNLGYHVTSPNANEDESDEDEAAHPQNQNHGPSGCNPS